MNVAELAATLGWDVDFETIARYQSELNRARENTAKLEADTKKLAEAEQLRAELLGDSSRALAMISPGVPGLPSAKGGGVEGAAAGAMKWGRALEIANAGLGVALKGYTILSAAVGRVRGAFEATAAAAAHANDISARTGLSVEAVQELGYAAEQSGTSLDVLSGGMTTLSNKVDAANKGSKDAAASLRAVGLSARDIQSGAVTLDSALGSIADRFAAMPDGARKSALAVDLFGQNGTKLIPLLNKGSKGVGDLRAEAQRLGIVMGKDAVEGAAALGDAQAKIGAQLDGIRNQVITALLPMLSEMAEGLSAWLTENREEIVEVLTIVGKGLLYILQGIAAFARGVAVAVRWVIDNWKLVVTVLALALLPLTLIVAGIWAIVKAFPYVLAAGEAVGKGIAAAFRAAARAITAAFRAVGGAFEAVWNGIRTAAREIGSFFARVGRGIEGVFFSIVNSVIGAINFVIDKLDWAIRQANQLPGVDIKQIGKIDEVGVKRTAMALPGKAVTNNFAAINVTSNAADPKQVAALVGPAIAAAMSQQLLETDATLPPATGVA